MLKVAVLVCAQASRVSSQRGKVQTPWISRAKRGTGARPSTVQHRPYRSERLSYHTSFASRQEVTRFDAIRQYGTSQVRKVGAKCTEIHSKNPIQYIIIRSVLITTFCTCTYFMPACLPASQTFSLVDIIKAESQSPRKKNSPSLCYATKILCNKVCGIDRAVPVSAQKNAPFALHRGLLSCRAAKDGPLRVRC